MQWLPSFLKLGSEDPLIEIQIDESRNILYTLSDQSSTISVYDLGEKGDAISHVYSHTSIEKQVETFCPRAKTWHPKIISMYPLTKNESNNVHLVAVTKTGYRLYFTTSGFGSNRPSGLELLHVRVPPQSENLSREQQVNQIF